MGGRFVWVFYGLGGFFRIFGFVFDVVVIFMFGFFVFYDEGF